MSNSRDEIEELRKRLTAVEDAVADLKAEILFMATRIAEEMCKTAYETFLPYQKGEQRSAYKGLWSKKLESLRADLRASKTVLEVFDKVIDFEEELFAYVKATKVDTADKAMEIAHTFIKKYSPVALPMKAEREGDVWLVDIDVGALAV